MKDVQWNNGEKPAKVTVYRELGRPVFEILVERENENGGARWLSIKLPAGEWAYSAIVRAIVRLYYDQDDVEAIILNYQLDPEDEEVANEFNKLQDWRAQAKARAKQLLQYAEDNCLT